MALSVSFRRFATLCCLAIVFSMAADANAKAPGSKPGLGPKSWTKHYRPHNPSQRPWFNSGWQVRVDRNLVLGGGHVRWAPRAIVAPVANQGPLIHADLAVSNIELRQAVAADGTPSWIVQATMRNIGTRHFRLSGQTSVFELYKDGQMIGKLAFSEVAAGAQLSLTATVLRNPGGYLARIVHYDLTGRRIVPLDREPDNDLLRVNF